MRFSAWCSFSVNFNPRSPHGERLSRGGTKQSPGRISIHAPRTGSDTSVCGVSCFALSNFNPRSPHGERQVVCRNYCRTRDFNPRSPHGERPSPDGLEALRTISIHAPRTGSDRRDLTLDKAPEPFQSTLPARGATVIVITGVLAQVVFQSTLPARGATIKPPDRKR